MNVFNLFAKLSLDKSGYDTGLSEGERQASTFGEKLKSGLGSAAKAIGTAVGAAAAGVAALATSAVKNYANYEQLVGGVALGSARAARASRLSCIYHGRAVRYGR